MNSRHRSKRITEMAFKVITDILCQARIQIGVAHVAISPRWSVKKSLNYLYKTIEISIVVLYLFINSPWPKSWSNYTEYYRMNESMIRMILIKRILQNVSHKKCVFLTRVFNM